MNFENQDYLEAESEEFYTDDEDNFDEDYDDDEYSQADPNKCYIALCELYNGKIHGSNNKFTNSQYLVVQRFTKRDLFEQTLTGIITQYLQAYRKLALQPNISHSIIRNYKNIISRDNYISPQIVKCSYLPEGECVAVIKTIWIRLIQRKWKIIFSERQRIIRRRSHISNIFYREVHGIWPTEINALPGIRGMLSQLKG